MEVRFKVEAHHRVKKMVQAWEQRGRQPSDAALRLLTIADKHPEVLLA
jgi:DNA-binding transcriptional regulator YiaG